MSNYNWSTGLAVVALILSGLAFGSLYFGGENPSAEVTSSASGAFERITKEGVIRAAYVKYPPTVTVKGDTASGFLVEVMDRIANEADLTVSYEETTFDNMSVALNSGRADLIVGAVFKTIPRAKKMGFTTPIMYWGGTAGVIDTSLRAQVDQLSDLNSPDITVAVTSGTAEQSWARDNIPKANLRSLPNDDISLTLAEVSAGRADVALADAYAVEQFAKSHPDAAPLLGGKQFESFAVSFVVRKEDDELREFLNEAIEALHVKGTIERLSRKYEGDQDIWDLPDRPRRN